MTIKAINVLRERMRAKAGPCYRRSAILASKIGLLGELRAELDAGEKTRIKQSRNYVP